MTFSEWFSREHFQVRITKWLNSNCPKMCKIIDYIKFTFVKPAEMCPDGYVEGKNSCFGLVRTPMIWDDASRHCRSKNQTLAIITNTKDNALIKREFSPFFAKDATWDYFHRCHICAC